MEPKIITTETMAASNTYLNSEIFKMPSEPCPLPSLGSDEESFVVLWKDMDNKSLSEDCQDPMGTSIVEEAKQLINKELSQIEQRQKSGISDAESEKTSYKNEEKISQNPDKTEQSTSKMEKSTSNMEQSTSKMEKSASKMEQSTVLPKMPQVERGFDTSDVISITTFSTDLSSEEVQKKISQIIEENIRLKDTILQNNMSMKSQYERIVAWQEDVQKVHQAHKDKIMEAKEFIERLKKENLNLNRDLEKLREIKKLQEIELNSLKETLKEKEQKIDEKLVKSAETNIKEFELDIANKKVKELELAVQNMCIENDNLKGDRTRLMKDVTKIEEYERQTEKLQELLDTSKMQVEEAKMELLKVRAVEEEKQKSLNEIIANLRSQLSVVSQQHALPLEEMANIRQQLTHTQIVLTQVEHSRAAAYVQIDALNNEMAELKKQIQDAESQKDEIYALQTQLEVYKADFEAERNAKETIKTENDKYSEDMQNLQRRNQQLQEEIEMLREHRDYVIPHRRRDTASSSSNSSNDYSKKCPKCNFGFSTIQALENHVYRCIELDDRLP